MKLFVQIDNLESMYEVLHAWSALKLFAQAGVEAAVVSGTKDKTLKKEKKGWLDRITGRREEKRKFAEQENCRKFAKDKLVIKNSAEGTVYQKLPHSLGNLIISEGTTAEPEDREEYFISSVILLNPWDFQEFISKEQPKRPYLFSYLEEDGLKKPEFIQKTARLKKLTHRYAGSIEPRYLDGEYAGILNPAELVDQVYHAAFVVTDSLIVAELAIALKKNFYYLCGGKREGDAAFLLQQLGLIHHFVYDTEDPVYEKPVKPQFSRLGKLKLRVKKQIVSALPEIEFDRLMHLDCPTNITKSQCYGCLACKEVCPTGAITMREDKEGFLYPFVDLDKCIRCGLCEKTCIRNRKAYLEYQEGYPKAICAANRSEKDRKKSSSGGIFPLLARYAIEERGGVVVGVRFDESMNAVSDIAETMEEVKPFYGSKYVKSNFDGIFPKIKQLLEAGRFVLYSGLPCECAGLRSYLRKEYDNLFVIEIMCHSVPSPKVFRLYLDYLEKKKKSKVVNMTFRDKSELVQKMKFEFQNGEIITAKYKKNNYFRAFYNDLIVRPSCSKCAFVYNHRVGDITMGDFWGVLKFFPEYRGYQGVSMLLLNTKKGFEMAERLKDQLEWREITFRQAFTGNHKKAGPAKPERTEVFEKLSKVPINTLLEQYNDLKQPVQQEATIASPEGMLLEEEQEEAMEQETITRETVLSK